MSAEAFETVMSCDMRTGLDGRGVERAPSMSQQPRWLTEDGLINRDDERPWASCMVYAEDAIRIAADAVRDQPMDGLTGDHPEKRQEVADELAALADRVRLLAMDHACDAALTEERWAR